MTANQFDWKTFEKTDYESRTFKIDFELGSFTVKNLDAVEMASVQDAVQKNRDMVGLLERISDSMSGKEKLDAVSEIMGIVKDQTPDQLVSRYTIFELGVVDPKPETRAIVIKFARVYPVEFGQICTKILELTGMGGVAKKKQSDCTQEIASEAT